MAELDDNTGELDSTSGTLDNDSGNEPNGTEKAPSMEDTIRNRYKELQTERANEESGEQTVKPAVQQQNNGVKTPNAATGTQAPEYPSTWRKNGSLDTKWTALDPEVRDEIVKRELDMRNGIESYKDKAGYADRFYNMITPYRAIMNKEGIKDDQLLENMLNTSYRLYAGSPEEKVMTLIQLAQRNGVNIEGVVQAATNLSQGKNAVDPNLLALQQQLGAVQNQYNEFSQAQLNQQFTQYSQTVTEFAADPAHKYINEPGVRDFMASIVESGQASSLKDAYEKAIGAIPDVRTKLFAEQQEALNKQAAAKATAAKNASSTNIKTTGKHTGKTVQKGGTMEDTIRNALRDINNRNS